MADPDDSEERIEELEEELEKLKKDKEDDSDGLSDERQNTIKGILDNVRMATPAYVEAAKRHPELAATAMENPAAFAELTKIAKEIHDEMEENREEEEERKREAEDELAERKAEAKAAKKREKREDEREEERANRGDKRRDEEAARLQKELKASKPGSGGEDQPFGLGIVFLLGLFFHVVVESFLGFNFAIDTPITITRMIFYLTLAFIMFMVARDNKGWFLAIAEVTIPILLIFLSNRQFIPQQAIETALVLWWLAPLFPIYISYEYSKNQRFFRIWTWAWMILVFILLLSNLTLLPFMPEVFGQLDLLGAIKDFGGMIWDATTGLWTALLAGFGMIPEKVNIGLDYATGGYYTGIVEDQQGEKVGLYLDEVEFSNNQYYDGDDVFLWASITGKSFRDAITVTTACYTNTGIIGTTVPDFFHVYQEGFERVQCKLLEVPEGGHTVHFTAGFNFDTWSYVTYTFVKQEVLFDLLRQDRDINRELDVDRILKPIYTPGPVKLGMSSNVLQPIGVDEDRGVNTVFGATLDNIWTDGEINRVREFLVYVPREFRVHDCDLEPTGGYNPIEDPECAITPDRCASEMDVYRFDLNAASEGPIRSFESITCRLALSEGTTADDLVPLGMQKVQKTFVVKASYDYTLDERKSLGVNRYVQ